MLNEASELSTINPGFDSRLFVRRIVMLFKVMGHTQSKG